MSVWESRIKGHGVWGLLQSLGASIDKASAKEDNDQAALDALGRLRTVLAFCGKKIGGVDPLTIPLPVLENVASQLDTELAQVDAFVSDGNIAHLNDANGQADALLAQLGQIPGITDSEELIALMNATSSYRSQVAEAAQRWCQDAAEAKRDVAKLRASLESLKASTDANIADIQRQLDAERQKLASLASEEQKAFTEAQAQRANANASTIQSLQDTVNKTITEQQGQFSTAQESRGREFTAAQADMQKKFGDLIGDYTKRLADQDAEFTKQRNAFDLNVVNLIGALDADYRGQAEKVLGDVNTRRDEVEKLVGVIGSLGVTSGYQKTANNAQRSMWVWQAVAVLAMIAVIFFAYHAFIPAIQGDFRWGGFATRVFLTVTVGVLAAYAVKQADRFFHLERQHRKLALELAAIDPFIALLPVEEQQRFKLEIGRRTFAQDDPTDPHADRSPATAVDVLFGSKEGQQFLQSIQKFAEVSSALSKSAGK